MLDWLTKAIMTLASYLPMVAQFPFFPASTLYGFRRGSAGPHAVRAMPAVAYLKTPQGPLKMDLFLPEGSAGEVPGVMLIHGGGWMCGNRALHRGLSRLLASHGFLAATIDYRLLNKAPWPACLDDCKAALAWLRAQAHALGLDPKRLGLLGDSSGAHLASMLALEKAGTPEAVAGVAGLFGPYILTEQIGGWWPRRCQRRLLGGPLSDPAVMAKALSISPAMLVKGDTPPFLLLHGILDSIVPIRSSDIMAAALREAGKPAEYWQVAHADHGFFALGRIEPDLPGVDRLLVDFMRRHLRGGSGSA